MEDSPQCIGRYKVIKELGRGASGTVYEVEESQVNTRYAAKLISLMSSMIQQAEKQANFYQNIHHSNILQIKESFRDTSHQCFVMILELCEGGDLTQKIKSHSQMPEILKIMDQIAHGVQSIHKTNIIHRDIKPENIFLKNGIIKIGDLGVSKNVTDTECKSFVGTLYYQAPEMHQNSGYDNKVDIWALGIIFLELTLGVRIKELAVIPPCFNPNFPDIDITTLFQNKSATLLSLIKRMVTRNRIERLDIQDVIKNLKIVSKEFLEGTYKIQQSPEKKETKMLHLNKNELAAIFSFKASNKQNNTQIDDAKKKLLKGTTEIILNELVMEDVGVLVLNESIKNSKVKALHLNGNYITAKGLAWLTSINWPALETLYLGDNKIEELNEWIVDNIISVKTLGLWENGLHDISEDIVKLGSLKKLVIRSNKLREIPGMLCKMQLRSLRIQDNKINYKKQLNQQRLKQLQQLQLQEFTF